MAPLAPMPFTRLATAGERTVSDDARRGMVSAASEAQRVYGTPTPVQYGPRYLARYGDLVACSPSDGPIEVILPRVGPNDIGRCVTIANVSDATGLITVSASSDNAGSAALVNGVASIPIYSPYAIRQVVAVARDRWAVIVLTDGAVVAGAPGWTYLADAPPSGAPATVELWRFDGAASMLTGRVAGVALALSSGSPMMGSYQGFVGLVLLSSAQYATAGAAAAMQIVGDLTVEAVISEKLPQASSLAILSCGDPNVGLGVGTTQCAYAMRYDGSGYEAMRYYHAGAGLTTPTTCALSLTIPHYVAFTRAGSTVTAYLNGVPWSSAGVAARPTAGGCATSQFRLQRAQGDTTSSNETTWYSVRVSGGAYTASQIAASYAQVRA